MLVLLVRHGQAGSKRTWRDDDRLRPLTKLGQREAAALVGMLAPYGPTRILSSPYERCLQTVAPLSEGLGLQVELTKDLVPDAAVAAETLLRQVARGEPGSVVVCTHGEVIHSLQTTFARTSPAVFGTHPPRAKGSVWVLERVGGHFVQGTYLAPGRSS